MVYNSSNRIQRSEFMKKLILGLMLGMMLGSATVAFAANDLIGTKITAVFASFNIVINGESKELETAPLVYNGTSYLPVKEISNLVGYDVTYKADSRTIELNEANSNTNKVDEKDAIKVNSTATEWISLKDLGLQVNKIVLGPLDERNNVLVITNNDIKVEIYDLAPPTDSDHGTFQLNNGESIEIKFMNGKTFLPIDRLRELNLLTQ